MLPLIGLCSKSVYYFQMYLSLFGLDPLDMLDVMSTETWAGRGKDMLQHLQPASVFLSYSIDCWAQREAGRRCTESALDGHLGGFSC